MQACASFFRCVKHGWAAYAGRVITIRTFVDNTEAWLARSLLESEGIRAEVVDDNMNAGYASLALNARLQVAEEDRERALEVLDACQQGGHARCRMIFSAAAKFGGRRSGGGRGGDAGGEARKRHAVMGPVAILHYRGAAAACALFMWLAPLRMAVWGNDR